MDSQEQEEEEAEAHIIASFRGMVQEQAQRLYEEMQGGHGNDPAACMRIREKLVQATYAGVTAFQRTAAQGQQPRRQQHTQQEGVNEKSPG